MSEVMGTPTMPWKVDIHAHGVQVAGQLAELIDLSLSAALAGFERRVLRVHVRLYGEGGGSICYIRVDPKRGEGVARGDVGEHAGQAVERAAARIRAAVMDRFRKGAVTPVAGGAV